MSLIEDIRDELNSRAAGRPIGRIQELRKTYRKGDRLGSRVVFGDVRGMTRIEGEGEAGLVGEFPYFFHVGGREGLQFNVGIDPFGDDDLRYGVAFSFEPSFSYPSIDGLMPRVQLFNDYLRQHPEAVADLEMWHYSDAERSGRRRPAPVPADVAVVGSFLFMGRLGRSGDPPFDDMLDVFDRLMPLWRFIEENVARADGPADAIVGVDPRPLRRGRILRPAFATASLAERLLDIDLRHNVLQAALVDELIDEHGEDRVGWEEPAPGGGFIDAVVDEGGSRTIFEIKTAATARGCIREALGQLLDYGCWPGATIPPRLVVVGEPALDAATADYLARLNAAFPTVLAYRTVHVLDARQPVGPARSVDDRAPLG